MPMYFEDFEVGRVFDLGSRTLSKESIVAFAHEFDAQPFHLDEEAAKTTIFGGLIASGWHTGSTLMGLLATGLLNDTSSQGSPGIDELRWIKPVYPGATLRGYTTVLALKPSKSKPHLGLVQMLSELRDEDDEAVLSFRNWGIFKCRDETAS